MPASAHVHYTVWESGKRRLTGFLIRAGKVVKKSEGRLRADPSPWQPEVARIFMKYPEVEEVSIMDKDGYLHAYYRDRT